MLKLSGLARKFARVCGVQARLLLRGKQARVRVGADDRVSSEAVVSKPLSMRRETVGQVVDAAVSGCAGALPGRSRFPSWPEVPISGSVPTTSQSRPDEPSKYSVGELLRIRIGGGRWHLALVQRDEVWDVERMKRLLDSLLAGYPVGALLLCRTDKVASKVIDRYEDEETVKEAPEGAYQLLDGQQRLNALYRMLTASETTSRRRELHGVELQRSAR